MAKGGTGGFLPPVPRTLAYVLLGLSSMILQGIGILQLGPSLALGSDSSSSSSSTSTGGGVGVNQGLLVIGSVKFGVVPVPNVCLELRGYVNDAVTLEALSSSTSDDKGDATTTVGSPAWPDLGDTEPRFRQMQRTGKSDGTFVFVTPETGVTLVLAAYSNGGGHPDVVRAFPDRSSNGGGGGRGRGDKITFKEAEGQNEAYTRGEVTYSSAFGVESGRLLVHIDLAGSEGLHAPEALWSVASREDDQSPCAQTEAASSTSTSTSTSTGSLPSHHAPSQRAGGSDSSRTQHDDHSDPPLAAAGAAGDEQASTHDFSRHWTSFLDWLVLTFDSSGFGGSVDQATVALMALLQSSYSYLSCVFRPGANFWQAKDEIYELVWSGIVASGHRVPESTLARFVWSSVIELPSLFVRVSTDLSSWLEPKSTEFSAWFMEASTHLFAWLEVRSPVDLKTWWVVYWAKVGSIAFLFAMLQEVFLVMCKVCRRSRREMGEESHDQEGTAVDDDHRCSEPHREEPATATKSMVGTFYGSDGKVSRLEISQCCGPEETTTAERRKGRGGIFGAIWSRDESKLATEEDGVKDDGRREESDEFSSMFRALNEPACTAVMESNEDDGLGDGGGGGGGGGASSVFVVTQQ